MIEDLLNELNVHHISSGNPHCRAGWIQLKNCVFCGSDNYHLGFNKASKYFHCWKCRSHPAVAVLIKLGATRHQVQELLKNTWDANTDIAPKRSGRLQEPAYAPLLEPHIKYLRQRGFDPEELVRLWQIAGIGIDTKLGWRIYIPILRQGKRVSWTTRAIGEFNHPRYVSAAAEQESMPHKSLVYGQDLCCSSIVIVEGPTDAWRVGPGAGALFGTAFTTAQVNALSKFPMRFICFDQDAQVLARQLAVLLAPFPGQTENIVLDAEDPGSATAGEIRRLRRVAQL